MAKGRGPALTAVDAARLHMSAPHNPMVITAALVMAGRLALPALLDLLAMRLLPHERFRRRVVEPPLGLGVPRWEDDPSFDLRAHVQRADLGGRSLESLIGALVSRPLDPRRPLWSAHLVEDVAGSVLVFRVHHCIADGAALIALLEALSDEMPGRSPPRVSGRPSGPPRSLPSQLTRLGRSALGVLRFLRLEREPATLLRRPVGREKRAAVSASIPLSSLVDVAHHLETTVTVVTLAAFSGALGELVHPRAPALALHALVPVSLRAEGRAALGNRYASVFVALPVGLADLRERARRIDAELRDVREHGAVATGLRAVLAAGVALPILEQLAVALFSRKASAVVSSVRGPEQPLHLGGVLVEDVLVWAPAPGSIPLGLTLMSYAGRARLGLLADARVVPDPTALLAALQRELEALFLSPPPRDRA